MRIKQTSNTLYEFINKSTNKNSKYKLTQTSMNFMNEIYDYILEGYENIPFLKVEKISENTKEIPDYICNPIYNDIKKNYINKKSFFFIVNNREICVYFYEKMNKPKSMNFYKECLKKMYLWLYVADKYACSRCSVFINIYLYFTDHLKQLPTDGSAIDMYNVNTAFTTPCDNQTDIHIYREEEWFKVFIHETFHNLGMDFSSFQENISRNKILELFPVNSEVRLYESYCETWAETIHTLFVSFLSTQDKKNRKMVMEKWEKMIYIETQFSLFQSVKLLRYYNMSYQELYDNSVESHKKRILYKEKTQALTYYIIKSVLLFHLNDFIKWSMITNNRSLTFKKNNTAIKTYCKLIESIYREPVFIENIVKMENFYLSNYSDIKMEYKTMRMTVYEN